MRLFAQVAALLTEDAEQLEKYFDQAVTIDDSSAGLSTQQTIVKTLAAAQADFQVPFGGVTHAALVMIVAFGEIEVRLNSISAPLLPVRPTLAVPEGGVLLSTTQKFDQPGVVLWRGRIDSIYLTNVSTTATTRVYVALAGETT